MNSLFLRTYNQVLLLKKYLIYLMNEHNIDLLTSFSLLLLIEGGGEEEEEEEEEENKLILIPSVNNCNCGYTEWG